MFLNFITQIHNLEFEQKPDYNQLQFCLVKVLMDYGLVVSKEFDWNTEEMFMSSENDIMGSINVEV